MKPRLGTASVLGAAMLLAACASGPLESVRAFGSVKRPPAVTALHGQSEADRDWDIKDCQAEAGYKTHWSPTDSALGNLMQRLFFWGTAGAAVGGTIDGPFPVIVDNSTATTGLIVGASTGGATGTGLMLGAESRYERAWAACMMARGYAWSE